MRIGWTLKPAHRPLLDVGGPCRRDGRGGPPPLARSRRATCPALQALLRDAGLWPTVTRTRSTDLRFGSVEAFVMTEVQRTPLGERLADDVLTRIIGDTREVLRPFTSADGVLDIPIRGHVIAATLRARRISGARRVHLGIGTRLGSVAHARDVSRSTIR